MIGNDATLNSTTVDRYSPAGTLDTISGDATYSMHWISSVGKRSPTTIDTQSTKFRLPALRSNGPVCLRG